MILLPPTTAPPGQRGSTSQAIQPDQSSSQTRKHAALLSHPGYPESRPGRCPGLAEVPPSG